jgi:hypothetical protein
MVEGAPRPARVNDSGDYTLQVVEHFVRRDAHGHEAQAFQKPIACRVPFRATLSIVHFAIDFNRQAHG